MVSFLRTAGREQQTSTGRGEVITRIMATDKTPQALRVLLVEDNTYDRRAFLEAVQRGPDPIAVTECVRPDDALALLRDPASSFDIVVVDQSLPGMSGLELCNVILGEDAPPPVVILTGSGSEELAVRALKAGVDDYLVKDIAGGYLELLPVVLHDVVRKHADRLARQHAEQQEKLFAGELQAVVAITDELIACLTADDLLRRTVELAREKLGLERCAIFVEDGSLVRGTYGTDPHGRTTDEHQHAFPKDEAWAERFRASAPLSRRWRVAIEPRTYWDGRQARDAAEAGWVASTTIRDMRQHPIAVFCNDAAISGAPCDERKQEVVAVFCSVLGSIMGRIRADEERRELEGQIQQAQKLESLGVLAGGIAHDFNNFLTGILGNASIVLAELPEGSEVRRSVEHIETAAQRAADLTRQMLAYSGKGSFVAQPIDLTELVEEMTDFLKASISKKAALQCDLARGLPAIEADASQVRQVVMNLITNASEALGDDTGTIAISTGALECDRACLSTTYLGEEMAEGQYVYVEVRDSGCGMDRETLGRIFDPFFTTKFSGRGLGLAATLGIVRGHRGALKVDSEPGRGTTFRILFPASSKAAREVAPREISGQGWQGSGTILVVDDEPLVLQLASNILERAGFSVLTATDGVQGVNKFRENASDILVVLLDMTMPRMSGAEVFREIRGMRSDARVLLSSGYSEEEARHRFEGEGPVGFLHKPYRSAALLDKLREILDAPEATS